MTDYGRGPGSEPWHPEDPLFGDQWGNQQQQYQQQQHVQAQAQADGNWDPYAAGQQPEYQQQPQYPQPEYQQQYDQQQQQQQYDQQQGYHQQQQSYGQQQSDGWGGAPAAYGMDPGDPYGNGQHGQQQADYYGQGGYPPPQRPQYEEQQAQQPQQGHEQHLHEQQQAPEQQQFQEQEQEQELHEPEPEQQPLEAAPEAPADWDPEPVPAVDDHAFFALGDDDDEDDDPREGRRARGGKGKKKGGKSGKKKEKRRSGCACLVVLLVLGGGGAGVSWYGYQYYQAHFGPAPDYAGSGKGEIQVEIPKDSTLTTMGNILKKQGVVKSVDAFTTAADENKKSLSIQAGIYLLHGKMSAASAIKMMLDPSSQNVLIIPEGLTSTKIYALIDTKLKLTSGDAAKAAAANSKSLGLPSYAKGNPEGFLYPARYSISNKMKPVALLKQMVQNAKAEYVKADLAAAGKKVNLDTAYDVVIEASILQAEVDEKADMGKAARALFNRLNSNATYGKLELDSTLQYHLGRTKLTGADLASKADGFNTYTNTGLPPAPISNPGADAIEAVLSPTEGDWVYWVTVKAGDTRFAVSYADHLKNVKAYCEYHGQSLNTTSGSCQ